MEKSDGLTHIIGVPSIDRAYGGPARTVTGLYRRLKGFRQLEAMELWHGRSNDPVDIPGLQAHELSLGRLATSGLSKISRNSIVHDNGLWTPWNLMLTGIALSKGAHLVISTRGMLEPWAMKQSSSKKRVAWFAYQRTLLSRASLLIATAKEEVDAIRALGIRSPIALIPNGVEMVERPDPLISSADQRTRTVLFLSRIHPKKGLELAIDAWAKIRPSGWRFRIVGPGAEHYIQALRKRIEELGLAASIQIEAPLDGNAKFEAYRAADLFLLPTYSENFGVVVAEALAAGTPVITTHGTPWSELVERACGWWIPVNVESLIEALTDAFGKSDQELSSMGTRGAAWVADTFSWQTIADNTLKAYQWVLGGQQDKGCDKFIHRV